MKTLNLLGGIVVILFAIFLVQCEQDSLQPVDDDQRLELRAKPGGETASNNLSFPVIWSFGPPLALPGQPGVAPSLAGNWWYVWGPDPVDPQSPIYSCQPDPEAPENCLDGNPPGETDLFKAWLQKDPGNVWQAYNQPGDGPVAVDWIDWGDNLESVDWTLRSQIRTEVVLFKDLEAAVTQYLMKHVSGWGTDEVHGLATDLDGNIQYGDGMQATVYSNEARLTIQRLVVPREQIAEGALEWVPGDGWTETDPEANLINEPIYNSPYTAEVNVKGRVIYGYTWNARRNNDGAGDYRITFSIDSNDQFTSLADAMLILPIEEGEIPAESSEEGGGATPVLVGASNLTYIDIRLTGGPSGGKGKGQGGN